KSAQIREILISESAWEEMTCLFAPSINNIELNSYSEQGLPGSNWFQNPNAVAFIQRPHS
ncbi:hypothetical protein AB7X59_23715, partial [Escherichia coli]|uniref:hypothetical protein n=1 Tax=Escherichia coli TaxID=562 RepID=UPI00321AA7E6